MPFWLFGLLALVVLGCSSDPGTSEVADSEGTSEERLLERVRAADMGEGLSDQEVIDRSREICAKHDVPIEEVPELQRYYGEVTADVEASIADIHRYICPDVPNPLTRDTSGLPTVPDSNDLADDGQAAAVADESVSRTDGCEDGAPCATWSSDGVANLHEGDVHELAELADGRFVSIDGFHLRAWQLEEPPATAPIRASDFGQSVFGRSILEPLPDGRVVVLPTPASGSFDETLPLMVLDVDEGASSAIELLHPATLTSKTDDGFTITVSGTTPFLAKATPEGNLVTVGGTGIAVWDLADLGAPTAVHDWLEVTPTDRGINDLAIDGGSLLIASYRAVYRWEPPAAPEFVLGVAESIEEFALVDNRFYVLTDEKVEVFDAESLDLLFTWTNPHLEAADFSQIDAENGVIVVRDQQGTVFSGTAARGISETARNVRVFLLRDNVLILGHDNGVITIPVD